VKRANVKTAEVVLRTAPYDPKFFARNPRGLSAAASSDLTASSDSIDARDDNAAMASADPTRPSAHAACARTNDSGSDNARVSAVTVSGDPQLPSPTQTLRAKPARPARRIAEPLENASQAASSSATSSSSTSEGASVPGCHNSGSGSTPNGDSPGPRAAYEGSAEGSENLMLSGHTPWEDRHP
jgi:hypothetical protein